MQKQAQANRTENYLRIEGLKTYCIQAGEGEPLVLFHGGSPGTCSSVNWKLNIEPLAAAGFAVYAYDQPGFGTLVQSLKSDLAANGTRHGP